MLIDQLAELSQNSKLKSSLLSGFHSETVLLFHTLPSSARVTGPGSHRFRLKTIPPDNLRVDKLSRLDILVNPLSDV